jgi:hypothetical protein
MAIPFETPSIRSLASRPDHAYGRGVKSFYRLLLLATAASTLLNGCSLWKKKSEYRVYEGDTSPGIKVFAEKPGYPLNTR